MLAATAAHVDIYNQNRFAARYFWSTILAREVCNWLLDALAILCGAGTFSEFARGEVDCRLQLKCFYGKSFCTHDACKITCYLIDCSSALFKLD